MSKSWQYLVGLGILALVIITGVQLFESLTGKTQTVNYQVDDIAPNFGDAVLEHLQFGQN